MLRERVSRLMGRTPGERRRTSPHMPHEHAGCGGGGDFIDVPRPVVCCPAVEERRVQPEIQQCMPSPRRVVAPYSLPLRATHPKMSETNPLLHRSPASLDSPGSSYVSPTEGRSPDMFTQKPFSSAASSSRDEQGVTEEHDQSCGDRHVLEEDAEVTEEHKRSSGDEHEMEEEAEGEGPMREASRGLGD
jgi:hypothetical protein